MALALNRFRSEVLAHVGEIETTLEFLQKQQYVRDLTLLTRSSSRVPANRRPTAR